MASANPKKPLSKLPYELYNFFGALFLLSLTLPLFVCVMLYLLIKEGRPIFYRGARLGKGKRIFQMYKFRTLVVDAEQRLKGNLLGNNADLITRTGKFLRDTRLDELPQLWNVLKRDMDLVGPRPERPEVYEQQCKMIPTYDRRFQVRPGLVGISQMFTPHSAPKRIRTLIDNRLIQNQESLLWNLRILAFAMLLIVRSALDRTLTMVKERVIRQSLLKQYREQRKYERFTAPNARCFVGQPGDDSQELLVDEFININVVAFLIRHREDISHLFPAEIRLEIEVDRFAHGTSKTKTARCKGELFRKGQMRDGRFEYVIRYEPTSSFNHYMIHQYFLHESIG